ncbi:MAG: methionine ABC transporter permease [Coriobacteriia bacterium]|nr:methionine ABC transporter permease [Coriobacteriia bacterium]
MHEFFAEYGQLLFDGTLATLAMVAIATVIAYAFGVPLGVLVTVTAPGSLRPHRGLNAVFGWIVNVGRSIPFIILLVALIPFTRFIVGTSLGTAGAIVPLIVAATPFVARMVESSLAELGPGVIEAALSYGASTWQVIWKVMLRESLPSIVRGASITLITLFGYSAMAGAVGAGGLGDIAIRYGYYRYQDDVMFATIVILIILVQVTQAVGDLIARALDKRNR